LRGDPIDPSYYKIKNLDREWWVTVLVAPAFGGLIWSVVLNEN